MTEECFLELTFATDESIDGIARLIPIKPTSVHLKGTPVYEGLLIRYPANMWRYKIKLRRPWFIDKGIKRLLKIFYPHREAIKTISSFARCELAIILYLCENTPCFDISSKTMAMLAEMNISIDTDIILGGRSEDK